jgi:hypothetical protein
MTLSEIRPFGFEASSSPGGRLASRLPTRRVSPEDASREPSLLERAAEAVGASRALHNLRGMAIALVVMQHTSIAYLASVDSKGYAFDQSPFQWLAFPVLDRSRWLGFDIFCAWQDVYLMSLMFFLSGVFAWPSLERSGTKRFLERRFIKLGGAFLFGVAVVMPLALYPVYRRSAADPSLIGYMRAYLSLPFLPNGPMWFLWMLLVLDVVAAALHRSGRRAVDATASVVASLERRPVLAFAAFANVLIAAYAPLAMAFTPWRWSNHGLFAIQFCRPLLYAAYFLLGLVVGRQGLGRRMLNADGFLAQHLRALLGLAAVTLGLWMALTGLALELADETPAALQLLADASFAAAGLASVLLALAAAFRFGAIRRPLVGAVADQALPIYLVHYAPVVWIQYLLLDLPLSAVAKAAIVFIGAFAISWGLAKGTGFVGKVGGRSSETALTSNAGANAATPKNR